MVTRQPQPMTPLDRVDEPDMGTGVIDQTRYTSPEFARLEWERMWTKVWNIAGPLCDIPETGDYFTHALGRESFIFMRTGEDEFKGFYNVCPHRGSRLRASSGLGHAEQLQCPFHPLLSSSFFLRMVKTALNLLCVIRKYARILQ